MSHWLLNNMRKEALENLKQAERAQILEMVVLDLLENLNFQNINDMVKKVIFCVSIVFTSG